MSFSRNLRAAALATALLCPAGAAAQIDEEDLPAPAAPESPASESEAEAAPEPTDATPAEGEPAPLTPAEMVREAERLYSEGDLDGATQLYRQAVAGMADGDERSRLLVTLATLQQQLGLTAEAVNTLVQVLSHQPDFPVQAELYGTDFVSLYFDARKRALEDRSRQAEERTREGVARMDAGDLAGARALLAEALGLRPNYPLALYDLALVAQKSGDPDGAIAGFQKLLALGGDDLPPQLRAGALQNVGLLYYERGFFEDAESHLAQAAEVEPNDAGVWNNLGLARRRLNKIADATAAFRRAYELKRADPAVANNLGLAYMDSANWLEAVGLLSEATREHPDNASLWLNLGIANRGLGNSEGALSAFRKALDSDADNALGLAARAATHLALALQEKGDPAAAAVEARRALAWNPKDVQAWTYLGLAQQAAGDLDGARDSIEKAQSIEPTSAEIANNLGSVYFRLGDFDRARATFERALQLRPDFLAATENLEHAKKRLAELETLRARLGIGVAPPRHGSSAVGVEVIEVAAASPAGRAGLQPGDRIVVADRVPLVSPSTLYNLMQREADLRSLQIEYIRNGKQSRMKLRFE